MELRDRRRKILVIVCAAVLAVACFSTGLTLAYLGTAQQKKNEITVGKGDVSIDEQFSQPSELQMSNNTTQKQIKIKNTGTVPCFIRVYAEFSDSEIAAMTRVNGIESTNFEKTWSEYKTFLQNSSNSNDWQYVPENDSSGLGGYFYYKHIVDPNAETTVPLITDVQYSFTSTPADSNIDKIKSYEMIVYSEVVQTVDTNGTEYTDAQWNTAWRKFLKLPPAT